MTFDESQDPEYDRLLEQYTLSLRSIGKLPEIAMRRAKLDTVLRALDIEDAVWWIDQLVRGALWGRNPEMDAMYACADWLIRQRLDDDYEMIQALYVAAYAAKRESILYLLRDFPPHQQLRAGARLPEVRLPITRNVTLGERRWFASGHERRYLERLVHDNEPLVIKKLLKNPHIQLQDVLAIASRRPTDPALLLEVALSETWLKEPTVREALVHNPYIYPGIALKLIPTLNVQILRKLRFAGDLHPSLAESAKLYVALREQRTAPWGH